GVPGIGVKTAAELINQYGDLENLLAHAEEIKQPKRRERLIEFAESARISRELVRLRDDVPIDRTLDTFSVNQPDSGVLIAFLEEQGFQRIIPKVRGRFGGAATGRAAPAAPDSGRAPAPTTPDNALAEKPPGEKVEYELVQDVAALTRWIAMATAAGVVAVDTETNSLDAIRADLVGVSLSIEPGRACYIPLAHKVAAAQGAFDLGDGGSDAGGNGDEIKQIPRAEALSLLKGLLEDPAVLKIGQNIKYDMLVLARYDLRIDPIDDTMLLSYVLDAGAHGHGMDELADLHLGVETVKFKDVVGTGRKAVTFDYVPLEAARDYAAEDADITLRLHGLLKSRLLAERMVTVYETLERPLVPVLVDMERRGIRVDAARLRELSDDFAVRLADLETEIHKLAGREFNVGSPKQLGEVLFEDMSLPGGKKSGKSDAYATGAEILEELAAQGHDMPARVLDWRQLAKLKSTYTDALLGQINPDTGRVHTSYSMAATTTGRLASSDPNLQNIPIRTEEGRKIRCAFVPKDGHVLLSADYSQIELRLLAHVAGIDVLKDAFRNDVDIHALTASQVFGVPIEGMDPMVRRKAKAINFGIVYGISAFGLANQLGIGRGEAAAYIEAYFEKYPGIRAYMDETKEQARKQGFVSTLYGRKVHLRGIADRNPSVRNFAERAAINAPIQGGAADIIKRAMIRLPGELKAAGLDAGMLLQVHDELVFEVPAAQVDATRDVVRRVMEGAAALSVPLTVDVGAGKNWGEAH
ncbi:MAG: DNA polymerase I, partial [Rhodospirillales bacterium]|nr:DNA polymerase I [Rhodospirillales bacterium]